MKVPHWLLAASFGLGVSGADAQPKVLSPRLKPGVKFTYTVKGVLSQPDTFQSKKFGFETINRVSVSSVQSGKVTALQEVLAAKITPILDPAGNAKDLQATFIDLKLRQVLDLKGKVLTSESTNFGAFAALTLETIGVRMVEFPEKALKVGSTWTVTKKETSPMLVVTKTTYKVAVVTKKSIHIQFDTVEDLSFASVSMTKKTTTTGKAEIEVSTGLPLAMSVSMRSVQKYPSSSSDSRTTLNLKRN